ncbi:type II secretion system F family protein [Micrococcus luteus]|nr:type II secretion system F family protein [Micrococcus luteus]
MFRLFALSVGAGESAAGALERIAGTARGELAGEFRTTLADMRAGASLSAALKAMGRRVQLAPVERFIGGVLIALDRGTPPAEVLRAQAQDVREMGRRELMEAAGRKEIQMIVPLIARNTYFWTVQSVGGYGLHQRRRPIPPPGRGACRRSRCIHAGRPAAGASRSRTGGHHHPSPRTTP